MTIWLMHVSKNLRIHDYKAHSHACKPCSHTRKAHKHGYEARMHKAYVHGHEACMHEKTPYIYEFILCTETHVLHIREMLLHS